MERAWVRSAATGVAAVRTHAARTAAINGIMRHGRISGRMGRFPVDLFSYLQCIHLMLRDRRRQATGAKHVDEIVIIGGPNGAGKTTASQFLVPQNLKIGEFVNADEMGCDRKGKAVTEKTPEEILAAIDKALEDVK